MNGTNCPRLSGICSWITVGLITCCTIGLVVDRGAAEELPRQGVLPLSLATKAAHAAVDTCLADGYRVSATVVDQGGNIRAVLRQDGAGPHTLESSRKKAYSSASLRQPTEKLAALIAKMPALQGLQHMNEHILLLAGGLPIELHGEVVGGIGVGGAPGGHLDVACAQAGLNSIGAGSKMPPHESDR
ncbi:MAG: hypothetical protein NPIRA02_27720 [Nitrospirales bacterium]|nr:MAG: hypothetical protein NPIRA02_27720 [Nitrospirales bacterium]